MSKKTIWIEFGSLILVLMFAALCAYLLWFNLLKEKPKYLFFYETNGKTVDIEAINYAALKSKLALVPQNEGYLFGGYYFDDSFMVEVTEKNFALKAKAGETTKLNIKWYDAHNVIVPAGLNYMWCNGGIKILGCDDKNIQSLIIPDVINEFPVIEIGDEAFKDFSQLENVVLTNNLQKIGAKAFYGCGSLLSLTVRDGVAIKEEAFKECANLCVRVDNNCDVVSVGKCDKVYFSASTNEIDSNKLDGLCDISVDELNSKFCSVDGVLFDKSKHELIRYPSKKIDKTYEIPSTVTQIKAKAFYYNYNLMWISIPDSVTQIGEYAFCGCKGLTSVNLPRKLNKIEPYTFYYCFLLSSITIPQNVSSIGEYAFFYCECLSAISFSENVTSIEANAFNGCSSLTNVVLPAKVTKLGDFAFCRCFGLRSVSISSSVVFFGQGLFFNCTNLTSIIYGGTMAQWGVITKASDWDLNTANHTITCEDGVI